MNFKCHIDNLRAHCWGQKSLSWKLPICVDISSVCKVAGSVLLSSSTLMQPTFGGDIKVKNLSHDYLELVCGNVRTPANQTTKHSATNLHSK